MLVPRILAAVAFIVAGRDSGGLDLLPEPEPDVEAWEEMLGAVNAVRAEGATCGAAWMPPVPELVWDSRLEAAAKRHARDMAEHDYFDHRDRDGAGIGERARRAGYDWRAVGENIARRQRTVEEVVEDWLASPGHCRQLLDAGYVEIGAAEHGAYWTQVFGVPR